jgi:transcriptional regulator GlxA family with amidase domain
MSDAATPDGHLHRRPEPSDMTTSHTGHGRPRRRRYRRVMTVVGTVVLTLITFAAMLVAGALVGGRDMHQPVPARQGLEAGDTSAAVRTAASAVAEGRGRRLVVAFVAGETGTVASDLLAPYDIFASSRAFTTYVVAADSRPVPLEGGPALVPTHTFADVDADPALSPDLVVVPALTDPTGTTEATLRQWVTTQHDNGARILGVCAGSLVLAETGMLDGLDATSHWSRISALQKSRPAVHWVRGRRWVEDGSVTTTAAVSSGVPAALHLVAELAGAAEAQRIADLHPELGWSPQQPTAIAKDHFAAGDWPVGLNFVEPWFRPTVGIALRDGVGELDATAAFEVYTQSAAARTVALASGDSVRTRHGLVLLTTSTHDDPSLSRVVVPGVAGADPQLRRWADDRDLDVEALAVATGRGDKSRSGGGFAAALENLDEHAGGTTAASAAKMIGYPTTDVDLHGGQQPVRTVLLVLVSLAFAVLVGLGPATVARRRRRPTVGSVLPTHQATRA